MRKIQFSRIQVQKWNQKERKKERKRPRTKPTKIVFREEKGWCELASVQLVTAVVLTVVLIVVLNVVLTVVLNALSVTML